MKSLVMLVVSTFVICSTSSAAIVTRLVDDFESSVPNIGGTRTLVSDAEIIEFGEGNQALRIKHKRGVNFMDNLGGRAVYEFPTLTLFQPHGISFDILEAIHSPDLTESAGFKLIINDEFEYAIFIGPITGPRSYAVGFAGLPDDISIHNLTITATSQTNRFEFVMDNVAFFDSPPSTVVVPEAMMVLFTSIVLGVTSLKPLMTYWRRRERRRLVSDWNPQDLYGD